MGPRAARPHPGACARLAPLHGAGSARLVRAPPSAYALGTNCTLVMSAYPYSPEKAQTELMAAAYNGDAEEVDRILTRPCDINAQDFHGVTALMYAAMQGHTQAVLRLVEHEADLELQSAQRFTALMYAVRGGHGEAVQALLRAN